MIFGLTNEQRRKKHRDEITSTFVRLMTPRRRFAFLPIILSDGRYLWCDYYWKFTKVSRSLNWETYENYGTVKAISEELIDLEQEQWRKHIIKPDFKEAEDFKDTHRGPG